MHCFFSFLNWISFLPKLWDFDRTYFAGVHWEDGRRRRSWPDTGPDNFTGWYQPLSITFLTDNLARKENSVCWQIYLRLNELIAFHHCISNQSSSGWDDEDRWSSEDEHNYEVTRTHNINTLCEIWVQHILNYEVTLTKTMIMRQEIIASDKKTQL